MNAVLGMAVMNLEAILASEFETAAKDLAHDLKLALGANFTVGEFNGARAVLSLVLGALPPPLGEEPFLAAFRQWVERERADADPEATAGLTDEEIDARFETLTDNGLMEMVRRPAGSAVDLALKVFLALWGRYGSGDPVLSLPEGTWTGENAAGHYTSAAVELALSDDLVRFVPELAPMLDAARRAGHREGDAA